MTGATGVPAAAGLLQPGVRRTFREPALAVGLLAGTFVLYYGVSYYFRARVTDADDFYVAGRSIGTVVNGSAIAATWESLATFMGVVALIVQVQLPFLATWANFLLSVPLIVVLYGGTLRRLGSYTPATFCRDRYGDRMAALMALLIVLVMLLYALGQFIGLARVGEVLLGWPFEVALAVIAVVVTGYVVVAGMYGVSYNAAIQFWLMFTAAFVTMALVLRQLGAAAWWFPPLGYGNLVPEMRAAFPGFFELTYDLRWYVGMLVAMGLGPVGMPHLAQRVFTSESVESGRRMVFLFVAVSALLFATMYAVGFAGVFWLRQSGADLAATEFDKMIYFLSLSFNGDGVAGYVVVGAVAGGLSTVSGHMLAISAAVGSDLVDSLGVDLPEGRETRLAYAVVVGAGGVVTLLALDPPAFLVVSILWAFALSAAAITPVVVLGVWSNRVNEYGAVAASLVGFGTTLVLSPHAFSGVTLGAGGLTAAVGIDAALVGFPLAVVTLVVGSLVAERWDRCAVDHEGNRQLLNEIHGYPADGRERFGGAWPLIALVLLALPLLWWGLQPW